MKHIKQDFSSAWVRPGFMGWDRGQNSTFSEYGHIKLKGMTHAANGSKYFAGRHPTPPILGVGVKNLSLSFSEHGKSN